LILDFEFDQHLESHKHVINIIMWFRDMGCYNGTASIQWGSEGGMMALRFGSSRVEEGGSWQRTARRHGRRGSGNDGSRRWEPMERRKWVE
jgi:hypothetical protein